MKHVIASFSACSILVMGTVGTSTVASAQDAKGIPVGGMALYPSLTVGLGYDDNIYRVANNETEAWTYTVDPNLVLKGRERNNTYALSYGGKYAFLREADDSNDSGGGNDYLDHKLAADTHLEFGSRLRLDLGASYTDGHDPRGVGASEGDTDYSKDLDDWHIYSANGTLSYGGNNAKGRVELVAGYSQKAYDNYRDTNKFSDKSTTDLAATFYYRVMPKTSLLFKVSTKSFSYDFAETKDNTENNYSVGATWNLTGKTTGRVEVGYLEKTFDDASYSSEGEYSDSSWKVNLDWKPRSYSTVKLKTSRSTSESSLDGVGYKLVTTYGVSWDYSWFERFSTVLGYEHGITENEADGSGTNLSNVREDTYDSVTVSASYQMRRWLTLGASLRTRAQDSDNASYAYDRNVYMLTLGMTL